MSKTTLILILTLLVKAGFCQQTDSIFQQYNTQSYIELGAGLSVSKFRDFATSPLFYSGIAPSFELSHADYKHGRVSRTEFNFITGELDVLVGDTYSAADYNRLAVGYLQLFPLRKISNDRWQYKIGGQLNVIGNIRDNPSLLNNGTGVDIFHNLFGTMSITRDVSRSKRRSGKILILKYDLKPKKRFLTYQLNIGLVNGTYRNGFAYVGQSWIINESDRVFDLYEYELFSGFRLLGSLDYRVFLSNWNGWSFKYTWDAYHTADKPARYEVAHHTFTVSLLYNLKSVNK